MWEISVATLGAGSSESFFSTSHSARQFTRTHPPTYHRVLPSMPNDYHVAGEDTHSHQDVDVLCSIGIVIALSMLCSVFCTPEYGVDRGWLAMIVTIFLPCVAAFVLSERRHRWCKAEGQLTPKRSLCEEIKEVATMASRTRSRTVSAGSVELQPMSQHNSSNPVKMDNPAYLDLDGNTSPTIARTLSDQSNASSASGEPQVSHVFQSVKPRVYVPHKRYDEAEPSVTYLKECPSVTYLKECEEAGNKLRECMNHPRMDRHLRDKHGLQHVAQRKETPSANCTGTGDDGGSDFSCKDLMELDKAAKELTAIVMRYPCSKKPMESAGFCWAKGCSPIRSRGNTSEAQYKAMESAIALWTDTDADSTDSALFSSSGIWISPFGPWILVVIGLVCGGVLRAQFGSFGDTRRAWQDHPLYVLGFFTIAMFSGILMGIAVWYRATRRVIECLWLTGLLLGLVMWVAEAVLSSCKCMGTYGAVGNTHMNWTPVANCTQVLQRRCANPPISQRISHPPHPLFTPIAPFVCACSDPWQWTLWIIGQAIGNVPLIALVTHPQHSFKLVLVAYPTTMALAQCIWLTNYRRFSQFAGWALPGMFYGIGIFLWRRRGHGLKRAEALRNECMKKYGDAWEEYKKDNEQLQSLCAAWKQVQCSALKISRRQSAENLYDLFREADSLNDVLATKMWDMCTKFGTKFECKLQCTPVKSEARALQKVFRSYAGDWRMLCDLCRVSLVFTTLRDLEECLRGIGDDTELLVVQSSLDKMRLRNDYAESDACGYRDIQLTMLLNTTEAKQRHVQGHFFECQLHLAKIHKQKDAKGHRTYKTFRNLSGK